MVDPIALPTWYVQQRQHQANIDSLGNNVLAPESKGSYGGNWLIHPEELGGDVWSVIIFKYTYIIYLCYSYIYIFVIFVFLIYICI